MTSDRQGYYASLIDGAIKPYLKHETLPIHLVLGSKTLRRAIQYDSGIRLT